MLHLAAPLGRTGLELLHERQGGLCAERRHRIRAAVRSTAHHIHEAHRGWVFPPETVEWAKAAALNAVNAGARSAPATRRARRRAALRWR